MQPQMEESIVSNIINVLKTSTDKTVIYKALVKLRTDLVKDRDGIVLFRKCGGIPPVVRLLNRPHEKILEVSLSILGNCCTDEESCKQALKDKIIAPLLTILKSIPNPIVQCRACRLLGNIAKDNREQITNIHSAAISQAVCLILEENHEIATSMMAARAIKFLVSDMRFLLDFSNSDGFNIIMTILMKYMKNTESEMIVEDIPVIETKPIGRKANQPREEYFREVARHLENVRSDIFDMEMLKMDKKKSTEFSMPTDKPTLDLISELLKCIQIISEMQNAYAICLARHSFPCLVYFAAENTSFRSIALRIIANFAKFPSSVLNSADTISAACYLATATNLETPLSDAEAKNCLSIICLLSDDACNRAKIRMSGALNHLLDKAKNYTTLSEISMVLFALNNFQYDHLSMDLLLRGGLVGILVKELGSFMNSDDILRKERCDEKRQRSRKRKSASSSNISSKNSKSSESDSPTSLTSNVQPTFASVSSPCSSRSISPVSSTSRMFYDNEEDDNENYSPVCSDIGESDDDDETDKKIDENSDIMKMLMLTSKNEGKLEENNSSECEDNEEDSSKTSNTPCLPTSTIDIIENLFLRITLQLKNRGDLSKAETLKTIIQAINVFGADRNNFSTSLNNIIMESAFFVIIIKQETIHSIYQMTRNEKLQSCGENLLDTLTNVAESGYGRGELTRLLTKGDELTQKRAACAVSFVIKSPKALYQHLTENGAIYTLLNSILNKNDEVRFEAVDGITSLSLTLGITLPTYTLTEFNYKEFEEDIDIPSYSENDDLMKFILHRGCSAISIKFDKKLLTENSDVFNSMLNSDFKESKEKEIHLSGYTVHGIKYFLNLMKLESENKRPNVPPIYHFESILEAYELSRMYILEGLEKKLFSLIVNRLDSKSCLTVFEWSLKNYNPDLSEIAINYYLCCAKISSREKVELYREADMSTYSKEWNQMIIDAILVRCQNMSMEG